MMRAAALTIAAALIIPLIAPVSCGASGRFIELGALAVGEGGGVVVKVRIGVVPGTGDLRVIGDGRVSNDVIASLNFSTWIASRLAHVDHNIYDYIVEIPPSVNVTGVSATLLFTLGYTLLLMGDPWDGLATATGILSPAGIVGNVSSVREKFEAAIREGYRRVIAPYNPGLLNRSGYIAAYTMIDAYEHFSGRHIVPYRSPELENLISKKCINVTKIFNISWRMHYDKTMSLKRLIEKSGIPRYKTYNESIRSINESLKYARDGEYYAAASKAFYAYWNMLASYIIGLIENGMLKPQDIIKWYEGNLTKVRAIVENYISEYGRGVSLSINEVDVIINALERYFDSLELYNISKHSLSLGDVEGFAINISIAIARLDTVIQWLNLTNVLSNNDVPKVNWSVTEDIVAKEKGVLYAFVSLIKYMGFEEVYDYIKRITNYFTKNITVNRIVELALILWVEKRLSNILMMGESILAPKDLIARRVRDIIVRILEKYDMNYGFIPVSGATSLELYKMLGVESLPLLTSILLKLLVYDSMLGHRIIVMGGVGGAVTGIQGNIMAFLAIIMVCSFILGYILGYQGFRVHKNLDKLFRREEIK